MNKYVGYLLIIVGTVTPLVNSIPVTQIIDRVPRACNISHSLSEILGEITMKVEHSVMRMNLSEIIVPVQYSFLPSFSPNSKLKYGNERVTNSCHMFQIWCNDVATYEAAFVLLLKLETINVFPFKNIATTLLELLEDHLYVKHNTSENDLTKRLNYRKYIAWDDNDFMFTLKHFAKYVDDLYRATYT